MFLGVGRSAAVSRSRTSPKLTGGQLTIYSSLPLQGPSAAISEQIVDGEKLALADAGGRAGPFKIGYVSLDDASPTSDHWNPGVTATDAKIAAQDTSTIAYLGDLDSAATAISLPLINAAGILQISPASPYEGLTSSFDAGQDEPERFYPSGKRTFVRLQPGDAVQAAAQVQMMRSPRRAQAVRARRPGPVRRAAGGHRRRLTPNRRGSRSSRMTACRQSAVPCSLARSKKSPKAARRRVFLAGGEGKGTAALWRDLITRRPRACCCSDPAQWSTNRSPRGSAPPRASTYLTTPVIPIGLYPPTAQRVLATTAGRSVRRRRLRAVRL